MYLTIEMTTQSEYKSHSSLLHLFLMYSRYSAWKQQFCFWGKRTISFTVAILRQPDLYSSRVLTCSPIKTAVLWGKSKLLPCFHSCWIQLLDIYQMVKSSSMVTTSLSFTQTSSSTISSVRFKGMPLLPSMPEFPELQSYFHPTESRTV